MANAAELKTMREALGLSQSDLALEIGVTDRAVRYWEEGKRPVPDDVMAELRSLDSCIDQIVGLAVRVKTNRKTLPMVRYMTQQHFDEYGDEPVEFRSVKIHAQILFRLAKAAGDIGLSVPLVAFDPDAYFAWLNGREDNRVTRGEWAATQL